MGYKVSGVALSGSMRLAPPVVEPPFNPVDFWAGQTGGLWNFASGDNLFEDAARTIPATVGGSVNGVTDLSGLNTHLSSAEGAPLTMQAGFCLSNNGGGLTSASFIMSPQYTAFILVKSGVVNTNQVLLDSDLSTGRVSQNILFHTIAPGMSSVIFGYSPIVVSMSTPVLIPNHDYYAAVAVDNINAYFRIDGVAANLGSGGTLASLVSRIGVGASFGGTPVCTNQPFAGQIYCAAWINKKCTEEEILDVGNYMKTIANLPGAIT